ncbi:ribose-phosphate diphosphokinase [Lactococcus termiticola]|uniref:Putative ribose-phosphate pyrophosphokinase n=1 Tax=Lactococcus termiticola TaxID=2169526 RepID=A0A2R5HG17_9LACT|nr:ribose-phosphate diphosphokinase [Lactococcus termiticola]GBG96999.1 ribose-phosphate pyrophosphokinase [Lactococcus termiticola]
MNADHNMKLFALSSNPELAQKIGDYLEIPLGKLTSKQFSDGEILAHAEESVRDRDVFIIQSTSTPVNDNLWELMIMIDACKRASVRSVSAVIPYFGYARQDRTAASRQPITAKVVADNLVAAGLDRVLTLDLHAVQVQGFFDIPVDNLFTVPLFAEYYHEMGLEGDDVVVVAPKNSGIKRARSLAEYLESPIAIVDYEDDDQKRENGYIIGNVKDKKVILIDDILNTARTFTNAAAVAKDAGAKEIFAVASHGLFSETAAALLDASSIQEILVTDSVKNDNPKPQRVKYLSAAEHLGSAIERIHEGRPVSPLFAYEKNQN